MTFEQWLLSNGRAFPGVGADQSALFDLLADFIEFRTGSRPALNQWGGQLNDALRGVVR
jgi:hypothetical protein